MFISADKIIDLIQVCRDVKERMGPEDHRIHVDDIEATLQKLIDDEAAELDKMAAEFELREEDAARLMMAEEEEWGLLQMEEAAIEKKLRLSEKSDKMQEQAWGGPWKTLEIDFDWPGGI